MKTLDTLDIAEQQAKEFIESVDWRTFFAEKAFEFKPKIKSPEGDDIYIGDAAYKTIEPLMETVYVETQLRRRIDFEVARDIGLRLFGEYLFTQSDKVKNAKSFKVEFEKAIRSELKSFKVIVPCNITYPTIDSIEIPFGRACLINIFRLQKMLNNERETLEFGDNQYLWEETETHYNQFFWFVLVEVPEVFNYDLAKKRASEVAHHVLNLLHLFISITHSSNWETGFSISPVKQTYAIIKEHDSKFDFSISRRLIAGDVGIPDSLWSELLSEDYQYWISIQSRCIGLFLDSTKTTPAVDRVLDAAYWIGDAIRERNLAARIVKYVFGMERLVLFKKDEKGKGEKFAKRLTLLLAHKRHISEKEHSSIFQTCKAFYKLRSDIVHGFESPLLNDAAFSLYRIDEVARHATLSLMSLVKDHLEAPDCDKRLRAWYLEHVPKLSLK